MAEGCLWEVFSPFPLNQDDFVAFLTRLLGPNSEERLVRSKRQVKCLENYLSELEPATAVVERQYNSKDYLEDYAAYYARCHYDYPRECVRIHFFREAFGDAKFRQVISRTDLGGGDADRIAESYLGFVILRPLPLTFIGTTCLKPYENRENQRRFVSRNYPVNLFGLSLKVNSVAFQEQDQAVAVCATAALWSALHQTSSLWNHSVPTPAMVTEYASEVPARSRAMPSEGLTPEQMARVIQHVGLEPQAYSLKNKHFLRSVVYAYLGCGIPVLMGQTQHRWNSKKVEDLAHHAVTITGMRLDTGGELRMFSSDRIVRLFTHDDHAVPYARVDIDPQHPESGITETSSFCSLIGTPEGHPVYAEPKFLVVPLYPKIRISMLPIKTAIRQLDNAVHEIYQSQDCRLVEWDVRLTDLAAYRQYLHANLQDEEIKLRMLTHPLPRYLWQATALTKDSKPILDFLFDATDIGQQRLFLTTVSYDSDLAKMITHPMKFKNFQSRIPSAQSLLWSISASLA